MQKNGNRDLGTDADGTVPRPRAGTRRPDPMKVLLSIVLVLSTFFACYFEDFYLYLRPPRFGQTVWVTLRAGCSFDFDQEKAFGGKRNIALSQYVPLYRYSTASIEGEKSKIEGLIKEVSTLQTSGRGDPGTLAGYVKKSFGIELSPEAASRILEYPSAEHLLRGILTIEESIQRGKVVEDPVPLKGKTTIQVVYPDPVGTVAFPATDFLTVDQAREELRNKVQQVFWEVDNDVLNPLLRVAIAALQPNLKYDQKENDRRIEEIVRRYPSRVIPYKAGEVLVPFHKVLDDKDLLLLAYNRNEERKAEYGNVPWTLFAISFMVVLYNLQLSRIFPTWWRRKPPCQLLFSVLIITVILLKACLLLTPCPVYALPFAVLPLLLVLLCRERIIITLTTLLGAILVSFLTGRDLSVFLFFTFCGLVAILSSFRIRKRWHIVLPCVLVGITNVAVVLLSSADWSAVHFLPLDLQKLGLASFRTVFNAASPGLMGWAFAGGLAAGPLVLLLLPLGELSQQNVSAFVLNRYADLQNPLMRDLLLKTPGTYQHAMTMAYLAQTVGEAIGANTLLLRVAAYYHDIGKTAHPEFFVENQHGGRNEHDILSCKESTARIMDHVTSGLKIARQAKLPEVIADFIPQHHGTLLIEYFYAKAAKENPDVEIREEDFRYSGPKPQSVEAAILMIVDAVEAASRTIEDPTPEKINAMIHHIIEKRLSDGQFDECDLSTREIAEVIRVSGRAIEAALHTRIKYPWQQEEERRRESESPKGVERNASSPGEEREDHQMPTLASLPSRSRQKPR
jgi:putative nucleotidyltransferase with HDIG domain